MTPTIKNLEPFRFPDFQQYKLDNGIKVYEIAKDNFEVIKLELVFEAGRIFEDKRTVARACSSIIREGAGSYTSEQLNEKIDFYGATIQTEASMDYSSLKLYCLRKFLPDMLALLSDILFSPLFLEHELENFKNREMESLSYELNKNDVIAYRKITELIFGSDHPYGYNSEVLDYKNLQISYLKDHYQRYFQNQTFHIFLSGKVDLQTRSLLNSFFGQHSLDPSIPFKYQETNLVVSSDQIKSANQDQQSLRLSKKMFNRNHKDFPKTYF